MYSKSRPTPHSPLLGTIARVSVVNSSVAQTLNLGRHGPNESVLGAFGPRSTFCVILLEAFLAFWLFSSWRRVHLWQTTFLVFVSPPTAVKCDHFACDAGCDDKSSPSPCIVPPLGCDNVKAECVDCSNCYLTLGTCMCTAG